MSGKNNAQHIGALAVAAIGTAAVAYFPLAAGNYGTYLANLTGVFLIAAIGLNITMGYAGQISLAHAAFMGIGAYTAALMMKGGLSFWLALPCSALMAGIFGFGLGFPALKVRRHYLAMVTLGFTMLFYQVARNEAWLTGGVAGLRDIPRPA